MAASDALRLNWDSKNFGPKVDMPATSMVSVAPARHRNKKVGFFKRSSTDLETDQSKISEFVFEGGRNLYALLF